VNDRRGMLAIWALIFVIAVLAAELVYVYVRLFG
jgi:hypothetical protein